MKAKILSKYSVQVINHKTELAKIESVYNQEIYQHGVSDSVINPILKKAEKKRTVEELLLIVKRKEIEDSKKEQLESLSEYKEFSESVFTGELGEFDSIIPYYISEGDLILQKWEVVKNNGSKIASKIADLKSELEDSDYKIIKCYETKVAGIDEMPYDIDELIKERQSKRDEINRLQVLLERTEPINFQSKYVK